MNDQRLVLVNTKSTTFFRSLDVSSPKFIDSSILKVTRIDKSNLCDRRARWFWFLCSLAKDQCLHFDNRRRRCDLKTERGEWTQEARFESAVKSHLLEKGEATHNALVFHQLCPDCRPLWITVHVVDLIKKLDRDKSLRQELEICLKPSEKA